MMSKLDYAKPTIKVVFSRSIHSRQESNPIFLKWLRARTNAFEESRLTAGCLKLHSEIVASGSVMWVGFGTINIVIGSEDADRNLFSNSVANHWL
jgi:hypothetical protein